MDGTVVRGRAVGCSVPEARIDLHGRQRAVLLVLKPSPHVLRSVAQRVLRL